LRNIKGLIIDHTTVDKNIYPLIMNYAIYLSEEGYANIIINSKPFRLHRYIYYDLQNRQPLPETVVDHMDHNKLNNKLCNLQEVIHGNNSRNRIKKENCTSKYYGVHLNGNKWCCELSYKNVKYSFLYDNELHAAYHHDLLVKKFDLQNHSPLNNIETPIDFVIKTKFEKKSSLPKNIYASSNNTYCTYSRKFYGKLSDKSKYGFKTVEKALLYQEQVLETVKKETINELNKPYDGPIKRNLLSIAIMDILNKNKEIVGETLIDDDIYCYLMKHERKLSLSKKGYVNLFIDGKKQRFHRWVLNYEGPLKIDHMDGNPLNNQKSNLRISTDSQNVQNRGASKNSTSKYVGVSFHKTNKKWTANIQKKKFRLL
jgi:hypothetical protein